MSIQMRIVNGILKHTVKPILKYEPFHKDAIWIARITINAMTHVVIRPRVKIRSVKITNSLFGEWIYKKSLKYNSNVCLYLHGGGYIACSPSSHRTITSYIAKKTNSTVLAIDYRKAPENTYPCALDDALSSYKYLLLCGYLPQNRIIAGDSAGGNLALVLMRKILDESLPRPAGIVALSPWCDLAGECDSIKTMDDVDPMIPGNRVKDAGVAYAGNFDINDSLLSPICQSFKEFPPTMFSCGELEVLSDEIKATFAKLQNETSEETLYKEAKGCCHVFQIFVGFVPESKLALNEICEFMEKHWMKYHDNM